jgi:hypothetical protein
MFSSMQPARQEASAEVQGVRDDDADDGRESRSVLVPRRQFCFSESDFVTVCSVHCALCTRFLAA